MHQPYIIKEAFVEKEDEIDCRAKGRNFETKNKNKEKIRGIRLTLAASACLLTVIQLF